MDSLSFHLVFPSYSPPESVTQDVWGEVVSFVFRRWIKYWIGPEVLVRDGSSKFQ